LTIPITRLLGVDIIYLVCAFAGLILFYGAKAVSGGWQAKKMNVAPPAGDNGGYPISN
jgi:hypothetical protein